MKNIKIVNFLVCLMLTMPLISVAQSYELPEHTSFKMPNGLTVYLMEQSDVPVISVSVTLPGGAIYDGDQGGLASLTASALKHGTQNYTKSELDENLDFVGASLNTYAGKETAGLSAKFASKDQEEVLKLIKEVILNPAFEVEEFKKEKKRVLVSLEKEKESPRSVIGDFFNKMLYGDHVYGNKTKGFKSTVSTLTIDDVKDFYKAHYLPNNAAISIVGDFSTKAMQKKISKLFAHWKAGEISEDLSKQLIPKPKETRVLLVNKGDAKETTFYVGSRGISRNNPDYVAIEVINTLFGGRFTSMLNDELRVNSGLTYGAGSKFRTYKYGGSFNISTFTATETTEAAIDKTLDVLDKLLKSGIDEESLISAKNYVKGSFPTDYETTTQLADLLTDMFWFDFDQSFINNFEKNVDALTLKKANQIIKEYFPAKHLQFVLIGKSEVIKTIAKKYGKLIEVDIKSEPVSAY